MKPYKPECNCKGSYNVGYFTWLCPIHGSVALKEWVDHYKIYDPKQDETELLSQKTIVYDFVLHTWEDEGGASGT